MLFKKLVILLLAAVMTAAALPACSFSSEPVARPAEAATGVVESSGVTEIPPAKTYEAVSFELFGSRALLAPGDIYFPGLLRVAFKNDQNNAHLAVIYDIYGRHIYYNNGRNIKPEVFRQLPEITFVLESSNPDVASIEGSKIVAMSTGEAVLTISLAYSAEPDTGSNTEPKSIPDASVVPVVKIEVAVAIPVKGISAARQFVELEAGETASIEMLVNPADASGVTLVYASRDEDIAIVSENGEITGVAAGETTIMVVVRDTVFEQRFVTEVAVTVIEPPPPAPSGGGGWSNAGSGSSGSGGGGSSGGGLTAAQNAEAYAVAAAIVSRHAGESETQLLASIASEVNAYYNQCRYTMDRTNDPYYDTPYGVFIAKTASCAGAVRAVNLCLSIAGYSYEHVNEWQYSHQWSRVYVASLDQYWVVDGGITGGWGLAAPEPAPYKHPWLS